MFTEHYLACDLAGSPGRLVLGTLTKGQLTLEEVHRFVNQPVEKNGVMSWNLDELEQGIFQGLDLLAERRIEIAGISTVGRAGDYVVLDREGRVLQSRACPRPAPLPAHLLKRLSADAIYAETGRPMEPRQILGQLAADLAAEPQVLQGARRLIPLADYFNALFCGIVACEESLAGTTQLYNPRTRAWSAKIMGALDLPLRLLPRIVPSATAIGPVLAGLRTNPALANARVIAGCSHDVAAAVASIPARPEQRWVFNYRSNWSHFGIESPQPFLSDQARDLGFIHQVGIGGTIISRETTGLWLVEECRRTWESIGQTYTLEELLKLALDNGPAEAHVRTSSSRFREPGEMPDKIAAYCHETRQPPPMTPGQIIRTALESVAFQHTETLFHIESLAAREQEIVYVVGRNADRDFFNQLTADGTRLPVAAATSDSVVIGNLLLQALALGHLKTLEHLRSVSAASFPPKIMRPGVGFEREALARYRELPA